MGVKSFKKLFWVTIFLNSFLLFLIEPIFGRILQPIAGSSVSSWNVALMCFQVLLLAGYMYTHFLPKLIGLKNYMRVHIMILLLSVVFSFAFFRIRSFTVNTTSPALDVILILLATIGIPFFVVSTSSTNFQRWYSLHHKESPYHLYSLSNFGNLLALIGYGIVIEVIFGLRNQILFWNVLYSIAVAFSVYIGITVYKNLEETYPADPTVPISPEKKQPINTRTRGRWTLLSFIPSALLIATNSVLDNVVNVNHIHYFWLLPLIVYLLAYIVAFSRLKLNSIVYYEKLAIWASIVAVLILFSKMNMAIYAASMIALFLVSLVCNMYVVDSAPEASDLTEFYMYIAIGGALGGIFASLISPLIFNNVYEFPLLIISFLFIVALRHKDDRSSEFAMESWEYALLFTAGLGLMIWGGLSARTVAVSLVLIIIFLFRRLFSHNKTRFLNLVFLSVVVVGMNFFLLKNTGYHVRNFYGIKTVNRGLFTPEKGEPMELVSLINGNTLHGSQFAEGTPHEFAALAYYDGEGSTVGKFFHASSSQIENVGIVGLGVGSLSALSESGQTWKYFEIDPQVIEIATDPAHFTMLSQYDHDVVLGDARITLQGEPDGLYDALVLDAYSGDLIPASLLTIEAIELYQSKIRDDGILLFHISNRQYDLKPVLSKAAETLGVTCYYDNEKSEGVLYPVASEWIMMTNNQELVADSWMEIEKYSEFKLWTDDRYSVTSVLRSN